MGKQGAPLPLRRLPPDAARLRGVLREWVLARSAPASPLARACALHLMCRDAGLQHDAGMMVMARLGALSHVQRCFLWASCTVCLICERILACSSAPTSPLGR